MLAAPPPTRVSKMGVGSALKRSPCAVSVRNTELPRSRILRTQRSTKQVSTPQGLTLNGVGEYLLGARRDVHGSLRRGRAAARACAAVVVALVSCTSAQPVGPDASNPIVPEASGPGSDSSRSDRATDAGRPSSSVDPARDVPGSGASSFPGPVAGAYRYRLTATDASGRVERREQSRTYAEPIRNERIWRQENVQLARNGDFTTKRVSLLEWRRWGVFIVSRDDPTQTIFSDGSVEWEPRPCSYEPPRPVVRFPLDVGRQWRASGSCRAPDDEVVFTYRTTWDVVGTERVVVDGESYDCFVIEEQEDDPVGSATRSWHSPVLGLTVRSESVAPDATGNSFVLELIETPHSP